MRSGKSRPGKFVLPFLLMLIGNELVSIIALTWLLGLFLSAVVRQAPDRS